MRVQKIIYFIKSTTNQKDDETDIAILPISQYDSKMMIDIFHSQKKVCFASML